MYKRQELKGYRALFGAVYTGNGEKLDDVVALFFASPRSYTGEDVVELSCHGGLYVKMCIRDRGMTVVIPSSKS